MQNLFYFKKSKKDMTMTENNKIYVIKNLKRQRYRIKKPDLVDDRV